MLYALIAIAVALTWIMFQTKSMMLGFPCVIFWAIMGGYCYTMSIYDWDIWYFLFFASFGMAIFSSIAMYGLRTKKEEEEEGDQLIDEGGDKKIRFIGEDEFSENEAEETSRQVRTVRDRAERRRTKGIRRL